MKITVKISGSNSEDVLSAKMALNSAGWMSETIIKKVGFFARLFGKDRMETTVSHYLGPKVVVKTTRPVEEV